MSHDWIRLEKAKNFPLHEYYVNLKWKRTVKRAIVNEFEELSSIYDIMESADETPKIILVEGNSNHRKRQINHKVKCSNLDEFHFKLKYHVFSLY